MRSKLKVWEVDGNHPWFATIAPGDAVFVHSNCCQVCIPATADSETFSSQFIQEIVSKGLYIDVRLINELVFIVARYRKVLLKEAMRNPRISDVWVMMTIEGKLRFKYSRFNR